MTKQTVTLTKGDRLRGLQARLTNPDGTPCNLTASTISFLMVRAADSLVKVNHAAATIVTPASGVVRYDWQAADVNTAGTYYAWFRRSEGGLVEHFPSTGRLLRVVFMDADGVVGPTPPSINVRAFGAKGDGVTDDLAAFTAAAAHLTAQGGGILDVPSGVYAMSAEWTIAAGHNIIIRGSGAQTYGPSGGPGTVLQFAHAGVGVRIVKSYGFGLRDIAVGGAALTRGIVADGIIDNVWSGVHAAASTTNAAAYALEVTTTDGAHTCAHNTFTHLSLRACNGLRLNGVAGLSNCCHHAYLHTTIQYFAGGVGINLVVADNIKFDLPYLHRASGSGAGVVFPDSNDVNGITWYHVAGTHGGFTIPAGCQRPGGIYGYDVSNGAPPPPSVLGLNWTTDGANDVGWRVPVRFAGMTARRASSQTISSGVTTAVDLPVLEVDPDAGFASPDFTVKRRGVYSIVANIRWAASGAGTFRHVEIFSSVHGALARDDRGPSTTLRDQQVSAIVPASVGDTFKLLVGHDAGSSVAIETARFTVAWTGHFE